MHTPPPEQLLERLAQSPLAAAVLALRGQDDAPRVALVGGAVRDLLLERRAVDLDLVVEGPVAAVAAMLGGTVEAHAAFETATVLTDTGRIDLARARAETYAHPGALPTVTPATVEQDLARRDFTINAIALPLTGPEAGELIAAPGALADLDARRLAVLHDASFADDPTRLLRLARYRARLGFAIAPHTRRLAAAAITAGALKTVSGARVGAELRLLAAEPDPVGAFESLAELGLDRAIDPDFGLADDADTLREALRVLPADGDPGLLALATAARRIPRPRLTQLLSEQAFTASDRDTILAAATSTDRLIAALGQADRPSQIERAARGAAVEAIALSSALASTAVRERATRYLDDLRHRQLEITGDDLIAAGVKPGPTLGRALEAARAKMLDGDAPDRKAQLAVALGVLRDESGSVDKR